MPGAQGCACCQWSAQGGQTWVGLRPFEWGIWGSQVLHVQSRKGPGVLDRHNLLASQTHLMARQAEQGPLTRDCLSFLIQYDNFYCLTGKSGPFVIIITDIFRFISIGLFCTFYFSKPFCFFFSPLLFLFLLFLLTPLLSSHFLFSQPFFSFLLVFKLFLICILTTFKVKLFPFPEEYRVL